MEFLRTPDDRFTDLVDFPFAPHYLQIADGEGSELRVHFLDEGSPDAPIVLLMHGQPSWSYLYRHMITPLVDAGFRVLAPDLIGFGRSDKPTRIEDYSYARHIAWMSAWLDTVVAQPVALFCQDWGGLIGLRMVADRPERFSHVVVSNTGLPDGRMIPQEFQGMLKEAYQSLPVVEAQELGSRFEDSEGIPGFLYWRKFCAEKPDLDIGEIMQVTAGQPLSKAEQAAYSAPFPDQTFMAGARRFPSLVPVFEDEPGADENRAAMEALASFDRPFMTAFADNDPVTRGGEHVFQSRVAGAQGVAHRTIKNAGHFVQQEAPKQCVQSILDVTGRA
ncbi:MAG: haloalkane dehalogenase [Pseudomonadota bacterium]